jgi:hypothetical protein
MLAGGGCSRRVEEGDIPYASFRDRRGRRPRVRVCVRDRDGRYCLPRRRPPRRNGVLLQPVLYKNTGPQLTSWRVGGRVVGRWRWRVVPESIAAASCRGGLSVELGDSTLRVGAIRPTGMSCRSGKRLIRRFFGKADSNRHCRRVAAMNPPTPGCSVGRFRCWRGLAKYCARRGQDVTWRDRRTWSHLTRLVRAGARPSRSSGTAR